MSFLEKEFIIITEIFPPSFHIEKSIEPIISVNQKIRDTIQRTKKIIRFTDAILVSDVRDEKRVKLSTIYTSEIIQKELGIPVYPVINARDSNKVQTRTQILTSLALSLKGVMLVWGDRYKAGIKNVYDYRTLSEMIHECRELISRSGMDFAILAPVNLSLLNSDKGVNLAQERLKKGADLLLSQPPTTDEKTLRMYDNILMKYDLKKKVLLNVFPFRDTEDVKICRERFGWQISEEIERITSKGENEILRYLKGMIEKIRLFGYKGVYVSTRGRPEIARFILE